MPDVSEAPEQSGQATETTEAPDQGQATESQESFSDFNPATDIPDDADKAWFEQKYNELRSGFTQKTQGLAQERQEAEELRQFVAAMQDPATRDQILEQEFGYQFEDEGQEEFLEPEEELKARLEQLEGHLTQQQQEGLMAQQESEVTEYVAEEIEELERSQGEGFEYSPQELAFISTYANSHPDVQGIPDVKAAGKALDQILNERQQKWVESKKAPRRISQGTPGSKTIEPKNRDERMALAIEAMEEAEA